jgi:hypothetical protein
MAGIFGGSAGPMGSNISDYTSLPNAPGMQGMGPIASGQQYGQFLQSQQPSTLSQIGSGLANAGQSYKDISSMLAPQQPMQFNQLMPARPQVQLQQANLMDFLSMLGGPR